MSMKQIHVLHPGTKLEFRGKEVDFHSLAKHHADKNARVTVCSQKRFLIRSASMKMVSGSFA